MILPVKTSLHPNNITLVYNLSSLFCHLVVPVFSCFCFGVWKSLTFIFWQIMLYFAFSLFSYNLFLTGFVNNAVLKIYTVSPGHWLYGLYKEYCVYNPTELQLYPPIKIHNSVRLLPCNYTFHSSFRNLWQCNWQPVISWSAGILRCQGCEKWSVKPQGRSACFGDCGSITGWQNVKEVDME